MKTAIVQLAAVRERGEVLLTSGMTRGPTIKEPIRVKLPREITPRPDNQQSFFFLLPSTILNFTLRIILSELYLVYISRRNDETKKIITIVKIYDLASNKIGRLQANESYLLSFTIFLKLVCESQLSRYKLEVKNLQSNRSYQKISR